MVCFDWLVVVVNSRLLSDQRNAFSCRKEAFGEFLETVKASKNILLGKFSNPIQDWQIFFKYKSELANLRLKKQRSMVCYVKNL